MRRLTQIEIARRVGLAQPTISEIFRGIKSPGIRAAKRLARIAGRDWKDYLDMPGSQIEAEIRAALEARAGSVVRDNPRGVSEHEAA